MGVFILPDIKMYSKGITFKLQWKEQCMRIEKLTIRARLYSRIYWRNIVV